jgi:hypothetical protein
MGVKKLALLPDGIIKPHKPAPADGPEILKVTELRVQQPCRTN